MDKDEERGRHSKSDNTKIMINDKEDEVVKKNFLNHSKKEIKLIWNRLKVVSLFFIMFIYCIIGVIM